jgi:hypothetical protein
MGGDAQDAYGLGRGRNRDDTIPPAELMFMAERAHAHVTTVKAPHVSTISNPGVVTSAILQAV